MKLERHSPGGCQGCQQEETVDVRVAIENLSRKYTQLGSIMAQYMSQAGMERSLRTSNAVDLAGDLARIVGGFPVGRGEFPECCLIGRRFPNGTEGWFCTGVLVHPRVVLTAAHCNSAEAPINVVALGAENMSRLDNAEIVSVRRVFVHPGFPQSRLNDIAVLILRRDAQVAPVPVATAEELALANQTILVGFGNDDILSTRGFGVKRKVEVPILHLRRDQGDDLDAAEQQLGFESDLEFVAGGGGFDSCNGDSGGPAYVVVDGNLRVGGLTSRGIPGTTNPCGGGGIYTRADSQLAFIRDSMRSVGLSPV